MTVDGGAPTTNPAKRHRPKRRFVAKLIDAFVAAGWRKKVIRRFCESYTDADFDATEPMDYHVTSIANTMYAPLASRPLSEDVLYDMGIQRRVCRTVWSVVSPLCDTSYTDEQLFDIAVEYLLNKPAPLSCGGRPYFRKLPRENEWHRSTRAGKEVYEMNYDPSSSLSVDACVSQLKQLVPGAAAPTRWLFHSTCWRYALDIMQHGPDHTRGRRCLDFGVRPGFYTTPDASMAMDWGAKKRAWWRGQAAVLVFSLNPTGLKKHKRTWDADEWTTLVRSSRMCRVRKNALDDFDVVEGPVCRNPGSGSPLPHPDMHQVASKSDEGDDSFDCLGCIWVRQS